MPLYEYVCSACGDRFERLVSHTEADGVSCRRCGSGEVRRLVSLIAAPRPAHTSGSCSCGGTCSCGTHP